ncbi:sensor histidine kinase [Herbaspirillum sp. GCM10030257]|uniref:sensor histidine kinase n=1 Tax=Herbaspirillum sp. GCM10030257 TaxID=3273393 RepID=UPI00360E5EF8
MSVLSIFQSRRMPWISAWCLLALVGTVLICRAELASLRRAFEADSRIAHRLLTQRTVQHDTILATLEAGAGAHDGDCAASARAQITVIYPQVLSVLCNAIEYRWDAGLVAAENTSRSRRHAAISVNARDFSKGRYWLVLAGESRSWALQIDIPQMIPRNEWPATPMNMELRSETHRLDLQRVADKGMWNLEFEKHLASESQPFDLKVRRTLGWTDLPWGSITTWLLVMSGALLAYASLRRQAVGRRRAEGLLRLRRAERLNTMGELAAGVAHELNQPLTAILSSCQAARRLLEQPQTETTVLKEAIEHAVAQARRASAVVNRLRTALEQPSQRGCMQPVPLVTAVERALHLLEPEFRQRHVVLTRDIAEHAIHVLADPVALDQILHNLLLNALQAMETSAVGNRHLHIGISHRGSEVMLAIADSGPGIPQHQLAQLFEPFFTTKTAGLGLGLTLCERLIESMGGHIIATNREAGGAEFIVRFVQPAMDAQT